MASATPRFGYVPNPKATEAFVGSLQYPTSADVPALRTAFEKRDVFLWKALLAVKPLWYRGHQAIGDCVSWGHELVATTILAEQSVAGESGWVEEVNTEALYGGMRVEAEGGKLGGYSDGWYGSGAVKYMQQDGVLLKYDYSPQTGNPDHDLRIYSGQRAKSWGNFGCGGKDDKGKLDAIAKKHPVKDATLVKSIDDAASLLDKGCPISICSDIGFETGNGSNGIMTMRDSNGVSRRRGSWGHCMMVWGVRYRNGAPEFRICNSWGKTAGGPDPGVTDQAVSDASWWCVAEDLAYVLKQDDSFGLSRIVGFALPPWDFTNDIFV